MRMRKDPAKASFPLEDLSSNDMACSMLARSAIRGQSLTNPSDVDGETGVSRVQSVSDGATLSFEIRSWPNDPTKERLDRGHKGPCAVYLKKVDSAVEDQGTSTIPIHLHIRANLIQATETDGLSCLTTATMPPQTNGAATASSTTMASSPSSSRRACKVATT